MDNQYIELVIFSTDSTLLHKLRRYSGELPYIRYAQGYGPQVVLKEKLDAIWTGLMGGVEMFGARPPFPLHEARIYQTPPAQLKSGMPQYGLVGVATSPDDPTTPEFNLRLVLTALLKAVREFNLAHRNAILRVGILPDDLELTRLVPDKAFQVIREIYEDVWSV